MVTRDGMTSGIAESEHNCSLAGALISPGARRDHSWGSIIPTHECMGFHFDGQFEPSAEALGNQLIYDPRAGFNRRHSYSVPPLKGLGRFLDCLPREKRLSNDYKNICGGNLRLSNREGRGRVSPVETGSGVDERGSLPSASAETGEPIQPWLAQPKGEPGAPGPILFPSVGKRVG